MHDSKRYIVVCTDKLLLFFFIFNGRSFFFLLTVVPPATHLPALVCFLSLYIPLLIFIHNLALFSHSLLLSFTF